MAEARKLNPLWAVTHVSSLTGSFSPSEEVESRSLSLRNCNDPDETVAHFMRHASLSEMAAVVNRNRSDGSVELRWLSLGTQAHLGVTHAKVTARYGVQGWYGLNLSLPRMQTQGLACTCTPLQLSLAVWTFGCFSRIFQLSYISPRNSTSSLLGP